MAKVQTVRTSIDVALTNTNDAITAVAETTLDDNSAATHVDAHHEPPAATRPEPALAGTV